MNMDMGWLAKELRIYPLTDKQRRALETVFKVEFVPKDMPIIHQGTLVRNLYLLRSGSVRIVRRNGSREVILGVSKKSRTFGEIRFFGDEPASANVISETPSELYSLSCENFQWLMKNHADVAMKLMAYILRSMGEVIRSMDNAKH